MILSCICLLYYRFVYFGQFTNSLEVHSQRIPLIDYGTASGEVANNRVLHPSERADLLKGLLIVLTYQCMTLFDASRVYHWIRGQSSIKLYVLFNVLDVLSLYELVNKDCGSSMLFHWTRHLRCPFLQERRRTSPPI